MTAPSATRAPTVRRTAFAGLLAVTMASSTFAFTTFSVLSGALLDAFAIRRWQLGALVTAAAVLGALLSVPMGRVSDRIGGRRSLVVTLALSGTALAAIAAAPVYLLVIAAAAVAGSAQAMANPATNKLISTHGVDGGRGMLTGIKQSGVQVGTFLGGVLLPVGAASIGWRPTLLLAALVPLAALASTRRIVPRPAVEPRGAPWPERRALLRSPFLRWLAMYGFLLGAGWSAVFTYLPDYGRNALGMPTQVAGLLVATAGLCGIAGRIGWSWFAEHRAGAPRTLATVAAISVGALVLLLAAPAVPGLVWLGAAAMGAGSGSWNSVGMFAVIDALPEQAAGAGSGLVMFGFLIGLGLGAPAFGWSVDTTGGYGPGLIASAVVHVAGLTAALALARAPLGPAGAPA